jgi:hypothetical protein
MQAFVTPGANTTNKFAVLVKKSCLPQLAIDILIVLWVDKEKPLPKVVTFLVVAIAQ